MTEVVQSHDPVPVQAIARAGDRGVHDRADRPADHRHPQRRPRDRARRSSGIPTPAQELAHDFVDVGPAGTVESWTWVATPTVAAPARPAVRLRADPARRRRHRRSCTRSTPGRSTRCRTGMRVAPRWRAARIGHITDIEAFVPGEEPVVAADDGGPAEEPVTMMDYNASITYTHAGHRRTSMRAEQANDEGRFLGLRCPVCGRTYTGGKGYCPVDAIELTPRARGRPAAGRRGHQLHDHHAGAVPGPDRDRAVRPGARVARRHRRRCSATRPLLDVPNDRGPHRHARRRRCGRRRPRSGDLASNAEGSLVGWMPDRRARRRRPRPREQDQLMARNAPTTSRSSAGTSRRWCAAPTRPRRRCCSR